MASTGYLESILNTLPSDIRKTMQQFAREAFSQLRFGAPSASAEAAENLGGHLVPFTTASVADNEVAVEHRLDRVPSWALVGLDLRTVNATAPVLTVTRAADMRFLYVSSPTTDAAVVIYVE